MAWPLFCKDSLTLGDSHEVAICSLWTPRDHLARGLMPKDYAVIGNLYSREGVNLLLRNVLASPRIRHLVLCGVDLSGTGEVLRKLIVDGIDAGHCVVGTNVSIDPAIPLDAIQSFRTAMKLHDHRGERDPERIRQIVGHLPPLPPIAAAKVFPRSEPRLDSFPAEETGHVIRERSVALAWLHAVAEVMRFGRATPTAYGSRQRELLDLITVVEEEDPANPDLPPWLPVSEELIEQYAPRMLEDGEHLGVSYTYGGRLRAFHGRDQLEAMAKDLRRFADSRRAVGVLWDPTSDAEQADPPCLVTLQARLRDGRLHLTAYLRSSDVCRAWPLNAFGLRRLQARLARMVEARKLGELVTVAGSAHIYEESWRAAQALLAEQGPHGSRAARFQRDPRGSFNIRLEPPDIVVDHYAPDGTWVATHRGSAGRLRRELEPFVSVPAHALYLGSQLMLAEVSLRSGLPYVQDAAVNLGGAAAVTPAPDR